MWGWVYYALLRDEKNAVLVLLKRSETQSWRQKLFLQDLSKILTRKLRVGSC